jgi:hypothetical protein
LLQLEAPDDIPYRALLERKEAENLSTTWLGDSVEGVGSGRGSRHGCDNTFPYRNMSSDNYALMSEL